MNIGLYELVIRWSEFTGCTTDDALFFLGLFMFIFIALLSLAMDVALDFSLILSKGVRKLFRFVRSKFRAKKEA